MRGRENSQILKIFNFFKFCLTFTLDSCGFPLFYICSLTLKYLEILISRFFYTNLYINDKCKYLFSTFPNKYIKKIYLNHKTIKKISKTLENRTLNYY